MHRFAAALGAGLFAQAAVASGPELLAPPAAVVAADHELTLAAKSALAADPATKPLSVLVSVVDGRAVVGGAVPTDAVAARIEAVLKAVPGLKTVAVECWVASEDPVRAAAREIARAKPKIDVRPPAVVVAMKAEPYTGGFLMDPAPAKAASATFSVPLPPAPAGPPQYPTIPSPRVPVAAADDLATAIETVRSADARFAKLRAVVVGDVVTVSGAAADGAGWDFVSAVRKVPGVGRVRVGRVAE